MIANSLPVHSGRDFYFHSHRPQNPTHALTHRLYEVYQRIQSQLPPHSPGASRRLLPFSPLHLTPNSCLGSGSSGEVYRVHDFFYHHLIAVKISHPKQTARVEKEYQWLCALKGSPFFPRPFYGLRISPSRYVMGLELLPPNLQAILDQRPFGRKGLPLPLVIGIAAPLLRALCELEARGIIHGDVKPANITCETQFPCWLLKLIDFDHALSIHTPHKTHKKQSASFRAPEVALGFDYSTHIDVWSLGVTLYHLYTGNALFPLFSISSQQKNIDLLNWMIVTLGPIPLNVLQNSPFLYSYFHVIENGQIIIPKSPSPPVNALLRQFPPSLHCLSKKIQRVSIPHGDDPELTWRFTSFLCRLIAYERPSASLALHHWTRLFPSS